MKRTLIMFIALHVPITLFSQVAEIANLARHEHVPLPLLRLDNLEEKVASGVLHNRSLCGPYFAVLKDSRQEGGLLFLVVDRNPDSTLAPLQFLFSSEKIEFVLDSRVSAPIGVFDFQTQTKKKAKIRIKPEEFNRHSSCLKTSG
jgi:hypothetical protein